MNLTLRHIFISFAAMLVAVITVILIVQNPAQLGQEPLLVRALVLSLAVVAGLVVVYPFNPLFRQRPGTYAAVVCLPAIIPGFVYFLLLLPQQAGNGFSIEQIQNSLITDSSSNGIVEVGFSYPIFTPTISLTNNGLYTRSVSVFLRMVDPEGEQALFRGVRAEIPGQGLSVESSIRGMLSENGNYLFNPLTLPPMRPVTGRVVFIISNLDDGASFTEALRVASQVQLELRNPETGDLLLQVPVRRD